MLLAFHNAFASARVEDTALDFMLPALTKKLQNGFCHYVDGGAGIGHTGLAYNRILEASLEEPNKGRARITCYEPLAENFAEMSKRLTDTRRFHLRKLAVSSANKMTKFVVPHRQTADNENWGRGTSYNGFVDNGAPHPGYETIEVEMVRLEDDLETQPDFVKLDLQGGELEAIKGLGKMLTDVKLLYIETQLMGNEQACQYLAENGFVVSFDKFQFGLLSNTGQVPIKQLRDLGIVIDRMYLPNGSGMPLVIFGYLEKGRDLFDGYSFSTDTKAALKKIGIEYFQTDAICINTKYSNEIFSELHSII